MFRIKICGLTRAADVRAVAESGADAIGLNFYSRSKRYVTPEQARTMLDETRGSLQVVGVFVNASVPQIRQIAADCRLDWIQLHGDELPEVVAQLSDWRVIRALPYDEHGWAPIQAYLDRCADAGRLPDALLLDAAAPGQYGGTGRTLNWQRLKDDLPRRGGLPWILAGGLNGENVEQAVRILQPNAVDTASGVESAPGQKDPDAVQRFAAAANAGWGSSTGIVP